MPTNVRLWFYGYTRCSRRCQRTPRNWVTSKRRSNARERQTNLASSLDCRNHASPNIISTPTGEVAWSLRDPQGVLPNYNSPDLSFWQSDDRDPVRVPIWFFLHLLVSYFPPRSTIPSSYTGLEEYKKSLWTCPESNQQSLLLRLQHPVHATYLEKHLSCAAVDSTSRPYS